VCVAVRDRQYRYLQAAHRNVYQAFDEDIFPFVDLTQHHEQQAAEPPAEQEEKQEEEDEKEDEGEKEEEDEKEEEENEDDPTDFAQMSLANTLNADDPISELDHPPHVDDVNDNKWHLDVCCAANTRHRMRKNYCPAPARGQHYEYATTGVLKFTETLLGLLRTSVTVSSGGLKGIFMNDKKMGNTTAILAAVNAHKFHLETNYMPENKSVCVWGGRGVLKYPCYS